MMTLKEAIGLVIDESLGEDSIPTLIRMRNFPPKERMDRVIDALKIVYTETSGNDVLDRTLSEALFGLSFHMQGDIDAQLSEGKDIPDYFIESSFVELLLVIESIFSDECLYE